MKEKSTTVKDSSLNSPEEMAQTGLMAIFNYSGRKRILLLLVVLILKRQKQQNLLNHEHASSCR